jgi:hypothetical protein
MSDQPIWGDAKVTLSVPNPLAVSCTSNGDDFSAVFSHAGFRLDPGTGFTCQTLAVSIRVPVHLAAGKQLVGYRQVLNFSVGRTPGVRVLIVADLAGTLQSVEFPFQTPPADGAGSGDETQEPLDSKVSFSPQGLEIGDGKGLFGPVADYVATILVTIQRRSLQEHGSVQLDGLDVAPVLISTTPARS